MIPENLERYLLRIEETGCEISKNAGTQPLLDKLVKVDAPMEPEGPPVDLWRRDKKN